MTSGLVLQYWMAGALPGEKEAVDIIPADELELGATVELAIMLPDCEELPVDAEDGL
jgi:hypothetical protein